MDIHSVKLIYFSPTHTTEKVLEGIARGIGVDVVERLDLTPPGAKTQVFEELHDGLAIMGAPVYGGRIPPEAVRRLRRIVAHGTPAVVVAVYGNRAYEDALLELRDLAEDLGFRPLAGGAFIGEHSYHTAATPIATGRPDEQDLARAEAFGISIRAKMSGKRTLDEMPPLQVPGNIPYKVWKAPPENTPITDKGLCTLCGLCVAACPTAAIAVEETVTTDKSACILCSACVKACPTGAREWEWAQIAKWRKWLSIEHSKRKEPEVHL